MADAFFRPYLHDEGILMQIVIHEYLASYQIADQLLKSQKKSGEPCRLTPKATRYLEEALVALDELSGQGYSKQIIPWQRFDGPLRRLEEACYLLVLHSPQREGLYLGLHAYIQKTRHQTKELRHLIQFWDLRDSLFAKEFEFGQIYRHVEALEKSLEQFAPMMIEVLSFFHNRPAVINRFLLEQKRIEMLFGKRIFKEWLNAIFPYGVEKGLAELEQLYKAEGLTGQLCKVS